MKSPCVSQCRCLLGLSTVHESAVAPHTGSPARSAPTARSWQRAPVLPWAPGEAGHEFCSEMALILSLWRNILLSWHRILFFVECVLKPLVHEGAIFHNRPILRPQIRCLWNKSFLSFGNYFFLSSFKLQFSSTDTVNFISRGSDIPQSVEKIYISTWSLSESFVVKSK